MFRTRSASYGNPVQVSSGRGLIPQTGLERLFFFLREVSISVIRIRWDAQFFVNLSHYGSGEYDLLWSD